jgi:hypothetical protein
MARTDGERLQFFAYLPEGVQVIFEAQRSLAHRCTGLPGWQTIRLFILQRRGAFLSEDLDDLLFCTPAQFEDQKRIFVEALGQDIIDGSDMLARIGPIRARAVCDQVALRGWEECKSDAPASAGGTNDQQNGGIIFARRRIRVSSSDDSATSQAALYVATPFCRA